MSESKCVLDSSVDIIHYGESGTSTEHGAQVDARELN